MNTDHAHEADFVIVGGGSAGCVLAARLTENADARVLLLEAGMRQTQRRLRDFEAQFSMATADFVHRYAADELEETLDTIEWLGEYRMAQTIQEKLDTLKGIRFAH